MQTYIPIFKLINILLLIVLISNLPLAFADDHCIKEKIINDDDGEPTLSRQGNDHLKYYLAVLLHDHWLVCKPNEIDTPYIINIPWNENVTFRWGIPAYMKFTRQIVYASTKRISNHLIKLQKNSSDKSIYTGTVNNNVEEAFYHYHNNQCRTSVNDTALKSKLNEWHDNRFWIINIQTKDFVKEILSSCDSHEPGTERLIRTKWMRPHISWIRFTSGRPRGSDETLAVKVAYSGEPAVKEFRKFYFKVNE